MKSPIGVSGPTRHIKSLSSLLSTALRLRVSDPKSLVSEQFYILFRTFSASGSVLISALRPAPGFRTRSFQTHPGP